MTRKDRKDRREERMSTDEDRDRISSLSTHNRWKKETKGIEAQREPEHRRNRRRLVVDENEIEDKVFIDESYKKRVKSEKESNQEFERRRSIEESDSSADSRDFDRLALSSSCQRQRQHQHQRKQPKRASVIRAERERERQRPKPAVRTRSARMRAAKNNEDEDALEFEELPDDWQEPSKTDIRDKTDVWTESTNNSNSDSDSDENEQENSVGITASQRSKHRIFFLGEQQDPEEWAEHESDGTGELLAEHALDQEMRKEKGRTSSCSLHISRRTGRRVVNSDSDSGLNLSEEEEYALEDTGNICDRKTALERPLRTTNIREVEEAGTEEGRAGQRGEGGGGKEAQEQEEGSEEEYVEYISQL
jgi:hypothetical protein